MKTWWALAAIVTVAGISTAASAQSYKAGRDFSYQNPNGVWQYGFGTTGNRDTFTRFGALNDKCFQPEDGTDCFFDNDSMVAVNTKGKVYTFVNPNSTVVIPVLGLRLHPRSDNQDTIVQFRAPAAGSYRIEGYYQLLDNNPSSIAPKIFVGAADVTQKAFREDAAVTLTGPGADPVKKKGGQLKRFRFTRTLAANAVVQFGLNPNGDFRFDSSAFDVTITPEAPAGQ